MRHSNTKTTFRTGAQRDETEGKGAPSLLGSELIRRVSVHLEKGARHYGPDNWRKGMPFRRTADSLIRHIFQWLERDDVEDHLAAIVCNAMFLMQFEKEHPELDDRWLKENLGPALTSGLSDAKLEADERADKCPQGCHEGQCCLYMDEDGRICHGAR